MKRLLLVTIIFTISVGLLVLLLFLRPKDDNIYFTKEQFAVSEKYADIPTYDIKEIPHFLSDKECDALIELAKNNLEESKVYNGQNDDSIIKKTRDSKQAWLKDDNPTVKSLSEKIKTYTNTHNHYYEDLQVVKYGVGGFFNPHFDPCDGDKTYCEKMNGNAGPRYLTVLIYLNDVEEGGDTIFKNINKTVKPEKGKAVIFQNVDEKGVIIKQSYHGGEPVKSGEKWIANKWIHLYETF